MRAPPFEIQPSAINCACKSVGKRGYSAVWKETARGRRFICTRIQSRPALILAPASHRFAFRKRRGHQQIFCAGDRNAVKDETAAFKPPRARVDITLLNVDGGAHR